MSLILSQYMDQIVKINSKDERYVIGSQYEHVVISKASSLCVLLAIA